MKISRKHLAAAAIILLTGGVFYTLNALTPRYGDDYAFALNSNGERLQSFSEVIERGVERYFTWDGRLIANTAGILWGFLDKSYFNAVNTLIYLALILLTQYHIIGAWRPFSLRWFIAINLGYWFLVPAWGQDFVWIAASAVYMQSTMFALAFLAVFRFAAEQNRTEQNRTEQNRTLLMMLLPLGFLAGDGNEVTMAATLFFLLGYWALKIWRYFADRRIFTANNSDDTASRKIIGVKWFEIIAALGFLLGMSVLLFAPGLAIRESLIAPHYDKPLFEMFWRFANVSLTVFKYPLWVLIGGAIFFARRLYRRGEPFDRWDSFYFVAGLAGGFSLVMSPFIPKRVLLIAFVFFIITVARLWRRYFQAQTVPEKLRRYIAPLCLLIALIFGYSFANALRETRHFREAWQWRENYIAQEKSRGNFDIVVPRLYPLAGNNPLLEKITGRRKFNTHTPIDGVEELSADPAHWQNRAIADYFGLNSFRDQP